MGLGIISNYIPNWNMEDEFWVKKYLTQKYRQFNFEHFVF